MSMDQIIAEAARMMGHSFHQRVLDQAKLLGLSPQTILVKVLRCGISRLESEAKWKAKHPRQPAKR